MFNLDVTTLSVVGLITSLILPIVLFASARFVGSRTEAVRTLNRAALLYAIGFFLLALRGQGPDWLVFFVGNMLIIGGYSELAQGFSQYFRAKTSRPWQFAMLAITAPWLYWCVVIEPDAGQRIFAASVVLCGLTLPLTGEIAAAALRLRGDQPGQRAERIVLWSLVLVFLLAFLSFAWRGVLFWNVHGDVNPATLGGRTWGFSFLIGALLNIALATVFPLLISRRNQQELQQSRALLQATENLAQVGSLLWVPDRQSSMANRVLCDWLGVAPPHSATLGQFLQTLSDSEQVRVREALSQLAANQQGEWSTELVMHTAHTPAPRYLTLHCASGQDVDGRRHVILSAKDITEFRTATERAIAARNEADQANAAKSVFLANMSHEIRTPMNGVLGLTRLALDGELPARERELIEKSHSSAQILMGVVNDILDFSKIEAGKLEVERIPFDLQRTIDTARNLFEQMAGGKGLRFVVDLDADVPLGLIGDPLRLSQILNNLLSNAVKFTERGEVRLHIAAQGSDAQTTQLTLSVQDTGIGIPADQCERLFRPFSQADASTTRRFGGTGLGLAICHRLATLMGGNLAVESTPGEGSRFIATLPFSITTLMPSTVAQGTGAARHRLAGVRVLLVEDNPTNVLVATLSLEREGALVHHCENGQEAVDYLRHAAGATDVVLMDIQMPVMDGYTASRILRKELGLEQLPIVAMTANVMDADRDASREAGMTAHVGKPFDMDELVMVLTLAVGKPLPASAPAAALEAGAPQDAAQAEAQVPPTDALGRALQRLGNDTVLLQLTADSLAADLPGMWDCLRQQPSEQRGVLHTLKGLTGTVGLEAASQLARTLEAQVKTSQPLQPAQIDALQALTTQSLQDTQSRLTTLLTQTAQSPAAVTEPQQSLDEIVGRLTLMLEQSDWAALEYFAAHRAALQSAFGDALSPLEAALQGLELESAAAACRQLMVK